MCTRGTQRVGVHGFPPLGTWISLHSQRSCSWCYSLSFGARSCSRLLHGGKRAQSVAHGCYDRLVLTPALSCLHSVLLFFFKILSFARGFSRFGPLVRMIVKIVLECGHFLMIMGILCLGFATAFSVALPEASPILWFQWMINTGVYGYSDILSEANQAPYIPMTEGWRHTGNLFLFTSLMVIVALILVCTSIRFANVVVVVVAASRHRHRAIAIEVSAICVVRLLLVLTA